MTAHDSLRRWPVGLRVTHDGMTGTITARRRSRARVTVLTVLLDDGTETTWDTYRVEPLAPTNGSTSPSSVSGTQTEQGET